MNRNVIAPRRRALTLLLCFLGALAEGFDLQSAAIAMQKLVAHFSLTPGQRTWVLTSNVLGLFIGAAIGGWLADRVGHKAVLVASMISFGLFSIGTALADGAYSLIVMRLLTGLGLGGAMPNLIAVSAESGDLRNRELRVTLLTAGIPFGGTLVPLMALAIGEDYDWRYIFWVGGIAPILFGVAMGYLLSESREYLDAKTSETPHRKITGALFGEGRALPTLFLWTTFLSTLLVLYLLLNWLPYLVAGMGFSPRQAAAVSFTFTSGGGFGALALGLLMSRLGRKVTLTFVYLAMVASVFAFAHADGFTATASIGFVVGFFVIGSQFLLYGMLPTYYPIQVRGTGVGWAVAIGRLGAVLGPLIAGLLLQMGFAPEQVVLAIIPAVLIALIAILALIYTVPPARDGQKSPA